MYTQEEINLITLSSLSTDYKIKRALLSDLGSSTPDFAKYENLLIRTLTRGVYNKLKADYESGAYREKLLRRLEEKGVRCVTYFSEDYPAALRNIDDPPVTLFCKGDTSLLKSQCFAVVGSRKTTPKALGLCGKISGELTSVFTVVSGLAEGADSRALEGAMNEGGKVISVLANGFDHVYPASNAGLLDRVIKCGLAVTEYPPEEKPAKYYFPFRNRIIAGLSRGTLVVSAAEKSGALITANYAADYGREVFALPYCPDIVSGEGCNALIKKGAYLAGNVLDIFSVFGLDFKRCEKITLTDTEREVYELIRSSGDAFLPEIADKLKKSVSEITITVMSLAMKQLVINLGGNRYSATV